MSKKKKTSAFMHLRLHKYNLLLQVSQLQRDKSYWWVHKVRRRKEPLTFSFWLTLEGKQMKNIYETSLKVALLDLKKQKTQRRIWREAVTRNVHWWDSELNENGDHIYLGYCAYYFVDPQEMFILELNKEHVFVWNNDELKYFFKLIQSSLFTQYSNNSVVFCKNW